MNKDNIIMNKNYSINEKKRITKNSNFVGLALPT